MYRSFIGAERNTFFSFGQALICMPAMLRTKASGMPGKPKKITRNGPGRLSAEDAAALPDRLLDAAFELFSAQGYAGTSMEEIAKKAGASTKTLYGRYAGKAELLKGV